MDMGQPCVAVEKNCCHKEKDSDYANEISAAEDGGSHAVGGEATLSRLLQLSHESIVFLKRRPQASK